jgi:hypothetical protein
VLIAKNDGKTKMSSKKARDSTCARSVHEVVNEIVFVGRI